MARGMRAIKDRISDNFGQSEANLEKLMDRQAAKVPANTFLWAALGAVVGSAALQISGQKAQSLFVGQWAPTFLLLGIYTKLSKMTESERIL